MKGRYLVIVWFCLYVKIAEFLSLSFVSFLSSHSIWWVMSWKKGKRGLEDEHCPLVSDRWSHHHYRHLGGQSSYFSCMSDIKRVGFEQQEFMTSCTNPISSNDCFFPLSIYKLFGGRGCRKFFGMKIMIWWNEAGLNHM